MSIRTVQNKNASIIYVNDHENPGHTGNHVSVKSGEVGGCDMWVPWCVNDSDFTHNHYITVSLGTAGNQVFWIWEDSGIIRFSQVAKYDVNASAVPGNANAGHDKTLIVEADGSISINDYY